MGFNHLAVRGWFRPEGVENCRGMFDGFQSPRGEGVVQTRRILGLSRQRLKFQSPRGEGVVQTKKDMFNFASTDKVSITSR